MGSRKHIQKTGAILVGLVIAIAAITAATLYLRHATIPVLHPVGIIGQKERRLMLIALGLSVIIVAPVFTMLFSFAWRYRASNTKATYSPDLDRNHIAETIWWLIPSILILILSVITWQSSHDLDPYKPLVSNTKPLTVQVVALDWKWLFIYPDQHIATVNYLQFPVNTPVSFQITSDTVMNSFWVPSLGGQIYAMPGMSTELHLASATPGSFRGSSANISGKGFAGMTFTARASSQADFDTWVQTVRKLTPQLTAATYKSLARPSENNPPAYYSAEQSGLYDTIVMKYMMPSQPPASAVPSSSGSSDMTVMPSMPGMKM